MYNGSGEEDIVEVLGWLKGRLEEPRRNIGEMPHSDSVALIEQLYTWGAREIIAINITSNGQYESAGGMGIYFPRDSVARHRLFSWVGDQVEQMGFDRDEDNGQMYVEIWKLKRWTHPGTRRK